MSVLLKDLVLDAVRLPRNWQEQTGRIAAENLGVPENHVLHTEILSASVDSRRGTPKLLLTLKADVRGVPDTPGEAFAAYVPAEPEIPPHVSLRHPVVVGTGPAGIYGALVLAMAGCEPLIVDAGTPVEARCGDYRKFLDTRMLDETGIYRRNFQSSAAIPQQNSANNHSRHGRGFSTKSPPEPRNEP